MIEWGVGEENFPELYVIQWGHLKMCALQWLNTQTQSCISNVSEVCVGKRTQPIYYNRYSPGYDDAQHVKLGTHITHNNIVANTYMKPTSTIYVATMYQKLL